MSQLAAAGVVAPTTSERQRISRIAVASAALVGLTSVLIVLGALVRAHGAGLACPDWPLCFGEVVPSFDLKVGFEFAHRVFAGSISLCFIGLAIAVLRSRAAPALRGWLALATGLLALQILLGALTVWQLLASWTVTSHLLTGNAFNAALLIVTLRLRECARGEGAESTTRPVAAGLRIAATGAALLLVAQLAVGGLVSSTYAGLACNEWPACADGVWFPSFEGARGTHLLHRLAAYALLGLLAACWLAARGTALGSLLAAATGIALLQAAVGVANVLLRIPVEVTALHSALAAGLVLLMAATLARAWRAQLAPEAL